MQFINLTQTNSEQGEDAPQLFDIYTYKFHNLSLRICYSATMYLLFASHDTK